MPDSAALAELAASRGGCFTRADTVACGWTHHGIRAEVSHGRWKRLHPGVYCESAWYGALQQRQRHLVDLHARLLVRDEGWCAARRSAAVVHDLPLLGKAPPRPLLVRGKAALSDRGFLRQERVNTLPVEDRTEVNGIPVTTLARTVIDMARDESFRSALVVADAVLARGVGMSELVTLAARCSEWPRAARVKPVLAHADGRAESVLESISRAAFLSLGLPLPEPQVEVWHCGERVARLDFLWREHNVIGEADGRGKYEKVEDLYAEKRREERLRNLGFEVVRWDWITVYRPELDFRDTLVRAFRRGDRSELAPGVTLRTTELLTAA